ncbi:MAG: DinB family protein [Blastocatellia bacterium]
MKLFSVIANQVRRVYGGDAWHGPSLREALDGVTAEQAAARPIGETHSIAELVAHIGGWSDLVRRRIGGETVSEPDGGDWPVVSNGAAKNWEASVAEVLERGAALADTIDAIDPGAATDEQIGNALGALHHAIYHTGQIAVLRKGA